MRIGTGRSTDIALLFSDAATIRNEDSVVNADLAFAGGKTQVAGAAQNSLVMVFNPAASGINVFIDGFVCSVSAAALCSLRFSSTELTTFLSTWFAKKLGEGSGLARLSIQLGLTANAFYEFKVTATEARFVEFKYPVQLPEGQGLIVACQLVNTRIDVGFWGREV